MWKRLKGDENFKKIKNRLIVSLKVIGCSIIIFTITIIYNFFLLIFQNIRENREEEDIIQEPILP